jgi:hypothetical protein
VALTIDAATDRVITLEEYLRFVREEVDMESADSLIASGPMLRALANNRSFLAEEIHRQLLDWKRFQPGNSYVAEAFLLGKGPGFMVRANFWTPRPEGERERLIQERVNNGYWLAHDHNFSFLTVGYFGPGYETEIHAIDPGSFQGEVGEEVELTLLERTTLSIGKVMYYQARRDVHVQHHPKELSISLNLLVYRPERILERQYYFDLERRRVIGSSQGADESHVSLLRLAGAFGAEPTRALILELEGKLPEGSVHRAARAAREQIERRLDGVDRERDA